MRFVVAGPLLAGSFARAQELSAPPMPPPELTPNTVLTGTPEDPKTFVAAFAARVSFFTPKNEPGYDISLGHERNCRTPCALYADAGRTRVTATRNLRSLVEDFTIPPGDSHVVVRSYSPLMRAVGLSLLGVAVTFAIVTAVFIPLNPVAVVQILITFFLPSFIFSIPGVVLISVAANRSTMTLVKGPEPYGTPGF